MDWCIHKAPGHCLACLPFMWLLIGVQASDRLLGSMPHNQEEVFNLAVAKAKVNAKSQHCVEDLRNMQSWPDDWRKYCCDEVGLGCIGVTTTAPTVTKIVLASPTLTVPVGQHFEHREAAEVTPEDENGEVTLRALQQGGADLPSWLHFDPANRKFSGTPTSKQELHIVVQASNEAGFLSEQSIHLKVTDEAVAPETSSGTSAGASSDTSAAAQQAEAPIVIQGLPDVTATVGKPFSTLVPSNTMVDPNGGSVTMSMSLGDGGLPDWLSFEGEALHGQPPVSGDFQLSVRAKNKAGLEASTPLLLHVKPAPAPPAAAPAAAAPAAAAPAAAAPAAAAPAAAAPAAAAPAAAAPAAAAPAAAAPAAAAPAAAAPAAAAPAAAAPAAAAPAAVAPAAAAPAAAAPAAVAPAAAAPAPAAPPAPETGKDQQASPKAEASQAVPSVVFQTEHQRLTVGVPFKHVAPRTEFKGSSAAVTFQAAGEGSAPLPEWLSFDPDTLTLSGVPSKPGVEWIIIKAMSDSQAAAQTIRLEIVPAKPPTAGSLPDKVSALGDPFGMTIPSSTMVEPQGQNLDFSASLQEGAPLPDWLHFDAEQRTFSGLPDQEQQLQISVTGTNPQGLSASTGFSLKVGRAPLLVKPLPVADSWVGAPLNLEVPGNVIVDPHGGNVTLTASLQGKPLPDWLHFDADARTFSGTPQQVEDLDIAVTGTSDAGISETTQLRVHIYAGEDQIDPIVEEANKLLARSQVEVPELGAPTYCGTSDVSYEPLDMNMTKALGSLGLEALSVTECQLLCRDTRDCAFFSFYFPLKKLSL
ncbi:unnamed protein product [Effrenium voratum]|uniref:Dystroglycan-type cadherin-like domain-containing protein n=1 Tax=Effrenium voratum TaxID=2562239 RepID=A0AA36MKI4_9DINO|nr:unnamed protein product [Effrenium voratum]